MAARRRIFARRAQEQVRDVIAGNVTGGEIVTHLLAVGRAGNHAGGAVEALVQRL